MNKISLKTSAKLNLFLKINGLTSNNYHDMTMINQSVDLYDFITVTKGKNGIKIQEPPGEAHKLSAMWFPQFSLNLFSLNLLLS